MVNKNEFISVIDHYVELSRDLDGIERALGIPLFESSWYKTAFWLFDKVFIKMVNKDFIDIVYEYLEPELNNSSINCYDRHQYPMNIFDEDGKEVEYTIATSEDLYNYLKENNGLSINY